MFDFGDRARAPQSSKARQWVEVRDWWSHSVLLTNAERRSHLFLSASTNPKSRVGFLTTTQITEGDLYLAPLTGDDSAVRQLYIYSRSSTKNIVRLSVARRGIA
ncbi:hypothetical protein AGABI1DRAFT_109143 [Agaricus bisporus var. burnettii JB137-S8]|uniref:Uncharacterized protein n=1 Tax=Agaricus bisporus var. burnettii (strain JB137-S8 / ATCC MYA-4627 / FGSC 10392) TaxID=597362 RepID=K5WYJ7_AGABU|nr:uncharacterized protein AGABI1DRAFT_109143 [Agaricus bisporus var. burnettii JB137-S8]EKM75908.1 hypothetical protein AGABI1DRAFT_109143 [Agaricus bisporus var. burnettii JB137-S8]